MYLNNSSKNVFRGIKLLSLNRNELRAHHIYKLHHIDLKTRVKWAKKVNFYAIYGHPHLENPCIEVSIWDMLKKFFSVSSQENYEAFGENRMSVSFLIQEKLIWKATRTFNKIVKTDGRRKINIIESDSESSQEF